MSCTAIDLHSSAIKEVYAPPGETEGSSNSDVFNLSGSVEVHTRHLALHSIA
jgi:hypothetical protein